VQHSLISYLKHI